MAFLEYEHSVEELDSFRGLEDPRQILNTLLLEGFDYLDLVTTQRQILATWVEHPRHPDFIDLEDLPLLDLAKLIVFEEAPRQLDGMLAKSPFILGIQYGSQLHTGDFEPDSELALNLGRRHYCLQLRMTLQQSLARPAYFRGWREAARELGIEEMTNDSLDSNHVTSHHQNWAEDLLARISRGMDWGGEEETLEQKVVRTKRDIAMARQNSHSSRLISVDLLEGELDKVLSKG